MEEGHSRLKGRRDNPKQMYVVLHSRHSWLYTSAADTEENVTSELEFLITLGDVFHRTDHHCCANHRLTRHTDAKLWQ